MPDVRPAPHFPVPEATCPLCKRAFALESFLEAASGYSAATDSSVSTCLECHEVLEFRIRPGVLELGYTYWAGSMHFEGVVSLPVHGLRLVSSSNTVAAELNGRSFHLLRPSDPSKS